MDKYEAMGDFFDKMSETYDSHMEKNVDAFKQFYSVVAAIPETQTELRILDIGCGTGLELTAVFKKAPNAIITAVDISGDMLDKLRVKYATYLNQITLIQESYMSYSFGEETYDYVMSVMTAHHLLPESKRNLYRRIKKALKPGGIYIEGD